jgi:molybdopterin synthase catalytic subunit
MATEERYARQLLHWGEKKQQLIESGVVLVAGVGGLGATVSQLLARAGVGKLYLVDDGLVDWPDLNRQLLYAEEDIGSSKLMLACDRLYRINSTTEIVPLPGRIDELFEIPTDTTAVADCLDNYQSRFLLDAAITEDLCMVHAGLQGDHGQVLTLQKGQSQSLADVFAGARQPAGAIPVTGDCVTVVAGLMTNELFSVLCGKPKLLNRCLVIGLGDFHFSFLEL